MTLPAIEKIFCCTDLSANSDHACRYALYMAYESGADIYVLYAAEKSSPDALVMPETYTKDFGSRQQFIEHRLAQAQQMLAKQIDQYLEALPSDRRHDPQRIKAIHVCKSHPVDEILGPVNTNPIGSAGTIYSPSRAA